MQDGDGVIDHDDMRQAKRFDVVSDWTAHWNAFSLSGTDTGEDMADACGGKGMLSYSFCV